MVRCSGVSSAGDRHDEAARRLNLHLVGCPNPAALLHMRFMGFNFGFGERILSVCMHTRMHPCMHSCIHTYLRAHVHACIRTSAHSYIGVRTDTPTCICVHTFMHTFIDASAPENMYACHAVYNTASLTCLCIRAVLLNSPSLPT